MNAGFQEKLIYQVMCKFYLKWILFANLVVFKYQDIFNTINTLHKSINES